MTNAQFQIWWTSADNQGSIAMGTFDTLDQAQAALPAAKAELLEQALDDSACPDDDAGLMTKSAVEAGTWSVEKQ